MCVCVYVCAFFCFEFELQLWPNEVFKRVQNVQEKCNTILMAVCLIAQVLFLYTSFTPAAWTFSFFSFFLSSFIPLAGISFSSFIYCFFFCIHKAIGACVPMHFFSFLFLLPSLIWSMVWCGADCWNCLDRLFVPSRKISITTLHLPQQWNSICLVDCFVSRISSYIGEKPQQLHQHNEFSMQTHSFSFFFLKNPLYSFISLLLAQFNKFIWCS